MSIRKIEKKFGKIALDNGFINDMQLIEVLDIQRQEDSVRKPHRLIGQILIDVGYMDPSQIKQVLLHMDNV